MTKKKMIFIIIVVIIVLVGLSFLIFRNRGNSLDDQIVDILNVYKFKYKDQLYVKERSELTHSEYEENVLNGIDAYNEILYFDLNKYQFKKVSFDYYEGMTTKFQSSYNYKNDILTFNNEISYGDNVYMFKGKFLRATDDYQCDNTKAEGPELSSDEIDYICDNIAEEVSGFYDESMKLFEDTDIRKKIKEL